MVYKLKRVQVVKADIREVWNYFSNPANLKEITPKDMNFKVTSEIGDKIYAGQIITYKVTPLWGITMDWTTEITHVEDQVRFVDEQRTGPYKIWHHEHHFSATGEGTEMTDLVHYALPYGGIGRIGHALIVKKKLSDIFDHRENIVRAKW